MPDPEVCLEALAQKFRENPEPSELRLWLRLKDGFAAETFEFQKVMAGYILDFYCDAKKLAIEVDGRFHRTIPERRLKDRRRDEILRTRHGVRTLRIAASVTLYRLPEALQRIRVALDGGPIPRMEAKRRKRPKTARKRHLQAFRQRAPRYWDECYTCGKPLMPEQKLALSLRKYPWCGKSKCRTVIRKDHARKGKRLAQ